ncbi:MAG: hypothetical protein WBC74_05880 [Candidatus Omnitrophota bacterium]
MLNDTVFRIAFALSLSLHIFAVSAGGFFQGVPPVEENHEIEVTYIIPEESKDEMQERIIENLPQKYDLRDKELRQSERKKTITEDGSVKTEGELVREQYLHEKELERLEEYIQYYELIREKIKKLVAQNYTASREEGAVEVAFCLDKNGFLKNLFLDKPKSAQSVVLRETALKSIRQCSPFPPFPESLKNNDLTFSLAIIFKKK